MKRINPSKWPLLAGLLLIAGSARADVQAILGDPTQGGRITRFAEGDGHLMAPQTEARGITFLPLDVNGRLTIDASFANRPQFRDDIPGASRIVLPGNLGVLYRFRRELPNQTPSFGFLRVTPDGDLQLIGERPGFGGQSSQDPYHARIALGPNGRRFLSCTKAGAGGDLLDFELSSGQAIDRSAGLPPLTFRPQSLRLERLWALAVSTQGVHRSGVAPLDLLTSVALEGAPSYFSGELVMSADGSQALTTAGTGPSALHAWVLSIDGTVRKASRNPQPMSKAGYLPEALHGPFLAVDNDGSLCAWRVEGTTSREVFARRATAASQVNATHITADGLFPDTLDEAGVLGMFQPGQLTFIVGGAGDDPGVGIERADFFELSLDEAGVATIRNRSGSSGESLAPFQAIPEMSPQQWRWLESGQALVMYDEQSGGTGRLVAFRPGTNGVQVILDHVKEVFFLEVLDDTVLVSLRLATGNKPHQLVRFPADLSASPSLVIDTGDAELLEPLVDRSGWLSFVEVPEFGPQKLHRYRTSPALLEEFPVSAESFGPVFCWTGGFDLGFSLDRAGLRYFAAWPRPGAAIYRLEAVATDGALLPGR